MLCVLESPGRIYCNYDVIMQCNFTCFLYSNLYYNITVHKTHSMRASDDVCIEASFNARFVYVLLLNPILNGMGFKSFNQVLN